MKTKSKSSAQRPNDILSKAHAYVKPDIDEMESESEDDNPKQLRKATEADKERKREKMRLKRKLKKEAKERSKKKDISEAKKQAISYLHLWNSSREMWTFKKKLQWWLLNNAFDNNCVSDEDFQILLEYLVDLKGEAKKRLTCECEKVIKKHAEKDSLSQVSSEDLLIFERARNILQILV